jgi:AcrR family transcriptional regulator
MARRSDHTREELYRMILDAARQATERDGLRALKARQIARDIGYTIGTIYNLFEDLDDLVVHMNGETLDELLAVCSRATSGNGPVEDLYALAERYLEFTGKNPNLWNAIFEHKRPPGHRFPDWYEKKIASLLVLEERALAPLFPPGSDDAVAHHALVLWTSLFGMAAVETSDRLPAGQSARSLVRTLIETYVAGLKAAGR